MGQTPSIANPFGPEHTKAIILPSSVNDFAFKTFRLFDGDNLSNSCYSPYSAFVVFILASQLFKGKTREEMLKSMLTKIAGTKDEFFASLAPFLTKNVDANSLKISNDIWPSKTLEFPENFLSSFKSQLKNIEIIRPPLDFSTEEGQIDAKNQINKKVEEATNGQIKTIIDENPSDQTALYLVNALYFSGKWKDKFYQDKNTTETFNLLDGTQKENVVYMHLNVDLEYVENKDLQSISLFYEGKCPYAMTILLPKNAAHITSIIKNFSFDQYTTLHNSMERKEIILSIPKFKVESEKLDITKAFKELGANKVFNATEAESDIPNMFVSQIAQKTAIVVNEDGTEAAAATAAGLSLTAIAANEDENKKPIIFKCDHPFVYIIRHKYTGAIIFIGAIKNPTEA